MSPIELTNSTMRSAPVWKTPVDAASSKGFLAVSVSPLSELLDWRPPIATKDKVGKSEPLGDRS